MFELNEITFVTLFFRTNALQPRLELQIELGAFLSCLLAWVLRTPMPDVVWRVE